MTKMTRAGIRLPDAHSMPKTGTSAIRSMVRTVAKVTRASVTADRPLVEAPAQANLYLCEAAVGDGDLAVPVVIAVGHHLDAVRPGPERHGPVAPAQAMLQVVVVDEHIGLGHVAVEPDAAGAGHVGMRAGEPNRREREEKPSLHGVLRARRIR